MKLSLKKLNLGANDMLQKEQLKTVFGGEYSVEYCLTGILCQHDLMCNGACPDCLHGTCGGY